MSDLKSWNMFQKFKTFKMDSEWASIAKSDHSLPKIHSPQSSQIMSNSELNSDINSAFNAYFIEKPLLNKTKMSLKHLHSPI